MSTSEANKMILSKLTILYLNKKIPFIDVLFLTKLVLMKTNQCINYKPKQ